MYTLAGASRSGLLPFLASAAGAEGWLIPYKNFTNQRWLNALKMNMTTECMLIIFDYEYACDVTLIP
jgi:hypothetical protein